jgi:hypothetical protein
MKDVQESKEGNQERTPGKDTKEECQRKEIKGGNKERKSRKKIKEGRKGGREEGRRHWKTDLHDEMRGK